MGSHLTLLGRNAVDVLVGIDEGEYYGQLASGFRVWLVLGRVTGRCNLTPLGFEFLTKLLAQSVRHRTQVLSECEPPLFCGLLREFLELLRDRLHGFLALGFQRRRKGVFNPILNGSHVAAHLIDPGFHFIRAACLQVLEDQRHTALDLSFRTGDDFAGDALEVRLKIRLKAAHGLVQRCNPPAQVRHFRLKLGRFRAGIGLYLFDLPAVNIMRIRKLPLQRTQQLFALSVEMCSRLQCLPLQFLDSGADLLLRRGGEFL